MSTPAPTDRPPDVLLVGWAYRPRRPDAVVVGPVPHNAELAAVALADAAGQAAFSASDKVDKDAPPGVPVAVRVARWLLRHRPDAWRWGKAAANVTWVGLDPDAFLALLAADCARAGEPIPPAAWIAPACVDVAALLAAGPAPAVPRQAAAYADGLAGLGVAVAADWRPHAQAVADLVVATEVAAAYGLLQLPEAAGGAP